jgi:NADH-quinone oxidoreductase subunit H
MIETVDQIFVILKHWLVGYVPQPAQPIVGGLISVVPIILLFPLLFALITVMERKGLGRIQNRYGPNRVGPIGLFQPVADGLKTLTKENIVPRSADKAVHLLAPLLLVTATFLGFAVLPLGRNMVAVNMDAGVLFFFAAGSITELSVFMAGWASHNKYSLLGAMRAIAQMISYEVPLILSSVSVIMITGTLSPVSIVEQQSGYSGIVPHWFVLTPWGFAGFVLFMIAATAESNRSPFDLPEGESELIAGYYTEYSGFKFALFFLAEYLGMMSISGMAITLFLGGWNAPLPFLTWVPSYFWFFSKLFVLICGFIWIRGTLPRLRMDQLMDFAWRFMLPMALVNLVTAGMWRFLPEGIVRWLVCSAMVITSYVLLGLGLWSKKESEKRVYQMAE